MKTIILLGNGYEEVEALTVVDYLRRAEIPIEMISLTGELMTIGSHGIQIKADRLLEDVAHEEFDMVITPGGMPNSKVLASNANVIELLQKQKRENRYIACICASPLALQAAGIASQITGTAFPGMEDHVDFKLYKEDIVVNDTGERVITSRGPATADYFALEIIRQLKGEKEAKKLAEELLIPMVEAQIKK